MNPFLILLPVIVAIVFGLVLWVLKFPIVGLLITDALMVGGIEAVIGSPVFGRVGGVIAILASIAIVILAATGNGVVF